MDLHRRLLWSFGGWILGWARSNCAARRAVCKRRTVDRKGAHTRGDGRHERSASSAAASRIVFGIASAGAGVAIGVGPTGFDAVDDAV
jgi:hypothetical protein